MSRNTRVQNQLRDQFIDYTQTTSSVATQFLRAAEWNLEVAINDYFAHADGYARSSSKEAKNLTAIFDKYKETDDKIGIDGTIQYIEDLGFDPEDKVTLSLAEFLESPSMGVFLRKPFLQNWNAAHIHTIKDMTKHLKYLKQQLDGNVDYLKKVYRFSFGFLLEDGQKTLALETAADYWRLLLGEIYGEKIEEWIKFLETEWKQPISRDAWNMFFVFLQDWHSDPELKNYDETAAWPSLIDEFVEYRNENSQ